MKIAVTGANGFVGRHILNELNAVSVNVIATTRNLEKKLPTIENGEWVKLDIAAPNENVYELMGRPDALIHLAWEGLPNYRLPRHSEIELPNQYNFLSQLVEQGLSSMVITGTCFEYGMQSGSLQEDMSPKPGNPYGLAKDALRQKLQSLQEASPFNLTWARLFYMYGEGQAENSLWSQLNKAVAQGDPVFNMSGGEQLRDFLPVSIVAKYLVQLTLNKNYNGIVNVCSGQPVQVKSLVKKWISENGWRIRLNLGHYPYPDYEPMKFWGDNSRLLSILRSKKSL
jgi:dTDP-6-deoxy-L-talose 4-dehydrogenase (NAD+)